MKYIIYEEDYILEINSIKFACNKISIDEYAFYNASGSLEGILLPLKGIAILANGLILHMPIWNIKEKIKTDKPTEKQ